VRDCVLGDNKHPRFIANIGARYQLLKMIFLGEQCGMPTAFSSTESSDSAPKHACPRTGCTSRFKRKADMERHCSTVHAKSENKIYECDAPRCQRKGSNGFTRKDHLTEHLRNYHHCEIPKRRKRSDPEEERRALNKSQSVVGNAFVSASTGKKVDALRGQKLACPFHKRDPEKNRKQRSCYKSGFPDASRVK
jgi:hypothetical protein